MDHFRCFDLLYQGVDFFRGQFASELGHVVLAVGDDVAKFVS